MTDDSMLPERRKAVRRRVVQPGTIVTDSGRTVPCLVRDLSTRGARLKLESDIELPEDFRLELDGNAPLACHVVRREPRHVAVTFR